ncbi:DUF2867 domain-containing protein [Candidatus Latescibacterota bacterium]
MNNDQIYNSIETKPWKHESFYCHDLPTEPRSDTGTILVTGASGYIGGRLVPELLVRGYDVRIMVRAASPEYHDFWPSSDIVVADAMDRESLDNALEGIDTAYYLIHSLLMGPTDFEAAEIKAAENFRIVAEKMGVKRIIYLGGLGDAGSELSDHLSSRYRVGQELSAGTVPVTVLRAAVIIGAGSASYEIIKHLVMAFPVLFIPRWAKSKCQPIAIRDVVKYLVAVLEIDEATGKAFDIGGEDVMSYKMMLKEFADQYGYKRIFFPLPTSNINLLSYVASLATPVPAAITRSLMGSLRNEVICCDNSIDNIISFKRSTYREAIVKAMNREEQDAIYTRWTGSYPPAHELAMKLHELTEGPTFTASYSILTDKTASALYDSICTIGGRDGWFSNNWMWRLRGFMDRIFMGVGDIRGRRSHQTVKINDVIGFWRIEDLQQDKRLLLRAEMKLPGMAWLEFLIHDQGDKRKVTVIPFHFTKTFGGKLYWYFFLPFHGIIFNNLIKQIEKRS